MRRAAAAALVAGVALAAAPAQGAGPVRVTRVQVSGKEFWYALSRRVVAPGPAIVEFVNFGEDPHDMRIRRVGGTRVYKTPLVQPGGYFDVELKLAPGTYRLWCSVANHEALGMKALLTVRAA